MGLTWWTSPRHVSRQWTPNAEPCMSMKILVLYLVLMAGSSALCHITRLDLEGEIENLLMHVCVNGCGKTPHLKGGS